MEFAFRFQRLLYLRVTISGYLHVRVKFCDIRLEIGVIIVLKLSYYSIA